MKLLVAVIVLVILGGGVWIAQKGDKGATIDDTVKAAAEVVDVESNQQIDETPGNAEDSEIKSVTAIEVDVDSAAPGDTTAGVEESAAESPFSTIAESATVAAPQIVEPNPSDAESVSSTTDTTSAELDAVDNAEREQIVVPQSYSVTEAAKYFIPKEERGPGRLGGPPPLDFPGGPSDPDRGDSETFGPPSAPGN